MTDERELARAVAGVPPPDLQRSIYRTMRLIRRFEERCEELVDANEIAAVVHSSIGQEAVATGVMLALSPRDYVTSTHRGHGHVLARGASPDRMMAELMGRTTGTNSGRGGSMHVADASLGVLGANGIVGAGTPMAVGAVWAARARGEDRVGVAFFGEGAVNQGVVHEALNLAAVWRVPVVFCCENNGYAVTTSIDRMTKVPLVDRGRAYGMRGAAVDGMDPEAVYEAARGAVENGRLTGEPFFLEARTYRFRGHHSAEAATNVWYRDEAEIDIWRKRDPLTTYSAILATREVLDARGKAEIDEEVERVIDHAVAYARSSPWPAPEDAVQFAYASGSTTRFPRLGWRAS